MSKFAIKYDACSDVTSDLSKLSTTMYTDLIYDLTEIVNALNELTYKPSTGILDSTISKGRTIQEKINNFITGLDNYAKKIYDYDDGFFKNFSSADSTNANLSMLDKFLNQMKIDLDGYNEMFGNTELKKQARNKILEFDNYKAVSSLIKGEGFTIVSEGSNKYIKLNLKGVDINDTEALAKYLHSKNILSDHDMNVILNGTNKNLRNKLNNFANRLVNEKIKITDLDKNSLTRYGKKLEQSDYFGLGSYLNPDKVNLSPGKRVLSDVWDSMKDDVIGEGKYIKDDLGGFIKDAKGGTASAASKLKFAGKALGAVDKIATIVSDGNDNLKDKNGHWVFNNAHRWANMASDTTIDLATSAAAAGTGTLIGAAVSGIAAGATGGSVVPGLGTIFGAVAGAAINVGINYKFGDPKESVVDKIKKGVKYEINILWN